ncbi:hypothetical protein MRB53_030196 [Persea americana]|uniref:Uncharacterized protein n=1 Tax=Persea americana TaxID=3435 RepID=A0ACC2KKW2_PERAE|nr:hypothetical protein MRB53_030196 [Persea americana]
MFVECGSLDDAIQAFEVVGVKNLWLWSVILNALCRNGCFEEQFEKFESGERALSRSRYFEEALELIRQMQNLGLQPDVASWTTLIGGYVGFGYLKEAVSLFSKLQYSGLLQDEHMFSTVLNACAGLEALIQDDASKLLSHIDIVSWNTLISEYMQKGNIVEAKRLFQKLQSRYLKPDLVLWNIMINCDAEEGNTEGALGVLARMQAARISPNAVSWNTLIKGYVRSKQIGHAMQLLSRIDSPSFEQNPGSWNTLMTNHINHGDGEEALHVFHLIRNHGVQPDAIIFTCILHALLF